MGKKKKRRKKQREKNKEKESLKNNNTQKIILKRFYDLDHSRVSAADDDEVMLNVLRCRQMSVNILGTS